MSEEIKKEMTDEELDNVAGAGQLEDLLSILQSNLQDELYMLEEYKKGGKLALVQAIIKIANKTRPDLIFLANDVVGLLEHRWYKKGYISDY